MIESLSYSHTLVISFGLSLALNIRAVTLSTSIMFSLFDFSRRFWAWVKVSGVLFWVVAFGWDPTMLRMSAITFAGPINLGPLSLYSRWNAYSLPFLSLFLPAIFSMNLFILCGYVLITASTKLFSLSRGIPRKTLADLKNSFSKSSNSPSSSSSVHVSPVGG